MKKQHTFKKSKLGETVSQLKEQEETPPDESAVKAEKVNPRIKIPLRLNTPQMEELEALKESVKEVAIDPNSITNLSIIRSFLFLAEVKKPEYIFTCIQQIQRFKYKKKEDMPPPQCLALIPEHVGILEDMKRKIQDWIDENGEKGKVTNSSFFKGLLIAAKNEKPETIVRHLKKTIF